MTLILAHHHPGRLRVRGLPFEEGSPVVAAAIAAARGVSAKLSSEPRTGDGSRQGAAVECVYSTKSGSLLVEYDPDLIEPDDILEAISMATGLGPMKTERAARAEAAEGAGAAARIQEMGRGLNDAVFELTGYRADLRLLVPASMAALGVVAFATQKNRMPRWDNLVYWGYTLFDALHREHVSPADPVDWAASDGARPSNRRRDGRASREPRDDGDANERHERHEDRNDRGGRVGPENR